MLGDEFMKDVNTESLLSPLKSALGLGMWVAKENRHNSAVEAYNKFREGDSDTRKQMLARGIVDGGELAGMIGATRGLGGLLERRQIFARVAGAESKAIGLTARLNCTQIKEYLANVQNMPREQLIQDLESVGLKLKGESPSGLFKTFEDKAGNLRVKIHPPDASTDYSHIHIYDKAGNSLTQNLTRAPYDLPDVHIRVEPIQKELEWSLRRQK